MWKRFLVQEEYKKDRFNYNYLMFNALEHFELRHQSLYYLNNFFRIIYFLHQDYFGVPSLN
jgi:hypothetical protein